MQYAMIIDLDRCIGCHSCAVACRAEWEVPLPFRRSWVNRLGPAETPFGLASTYYPGHCNHCEKPACVPVCPVAPEKKEFVHQGTGFRESRPVSATWKDPFNGSVQIDKERCIGCGACVQACPYGARHVNDKLEKPKADKCSFCVERIVQGKRPACVETCISDARIFGDVDDPDSEVSQYLAQGAIRLESTQVRIGPNVLYYGKKRDVYLLTETSTPQVLPMVSHRRIVLAGLGEYVIRRSGKNM